MFRTARFYNIRTTNAKVNTLFTHLHFTNLTHIVDKRFKLDIIRVLNKLLQSMLFYLAYTIAIIFLGG